MIPAAGRGSRLGLDTPKILAPLDDARTVWTILRNRLLPAVARIHVVLSADGLPLFERQIAADPERGRISTSVQPAPRGMGDAIFGAREAWKNSGRLLILWGDQVNVSAATIARALEASGTRQTIALPLAEVEDAYVQYDFDTNGRLVRVRQKREGDRMDRPAWADVGLFVLATHQLEDAWHGYLEAAAPGAATGEINFLPFLSYLSVEAGWTVCTVPVGDPDEALGINTPADLEAARARLSGLAAAR